MKYIQLLESYSHNITNSFLKNIKNYTCSVEEINQGYCDEISYSVIKDVIGKERYIDINDLSS